MKPSVFLASPPFPEREKPETSAHKFTTTTHSTRLVHPSNPLLWWITDNKQMCCVLSRHYTELLEETWD